MEALELIPVQNHKFIRHQLEDLAVVVEFEDQHAGTWNFWSRQQWIWCIWNKPRAKSTEAENSGIDEWRCWILFTLIRYISSLELVVAGSQQSTMLSGGGGTGAGATNKGSGGQGYAGYKGYGSAGGSGLVLVGSEDGSGGFGGLDENNIVTVNRC